MYSPYELFILENRYVRLICLMGKMRGWMEGKIESILLILGQLEPSPVLLELTTQRLNRVHDIQLLNHLEIGALLLSDKQDVHKWLDEYFPQKSEKENKIESILKTLRTRLQLPPLLWEPIIQALIRIDNIQILEQLEIEALRTENIEKAHKFRKLLRQESSSVAENDEQLVTTASSWGYFALDMLNEYFPKSNKENIYQWFDRCLRQKSVLHLSQIDIEDKSEAYQEKQNINAFDETSPIIQTKHAIRSTEEIRKDFPILSRQVHGKPLVYLDSTASSQKPTVVIEAMNHYYQTYHANIHRGVYQISEEATIAMDKARVKIARFINARQSKQVIFTRNTTESINLVAYSWGTENIHADDLIVLTEMEHHSNLVPWQLLAQRTGAHLEFIPVSDDGLLRLDIYQQLLQRQPKLVAFTHMSNVLGTINPAKEMIAQARAAGAIVLLDAAQSVPHLPVNVEDLDVDFLAFSGHKMLGPTGIGVLYGKRALLEAMPPFMGGGDMIRSVHLRESTWNDLPWKFEAGTPAIAEAIGLGVAVDYLTELGMAAVQQHEREMTSYALEQLRAISDLKIYGPDASQRGGVISFTLDDIHPHDLASIVDQEMGVAIRAGHHCAQPLMERFGLAATARASFYIYTLPEEIDILVQGLRKAQQIFHF